MIRTRLQNSTVRRLRWISAAFALWCALVIPAWASSRLSGNLTDPSGNVVPGASVLLLRLVDSSPNKIITDSQGQFFFADLNPGEYRLTAEFPGFSTVTRTIALADAQNRTETFQFSTIAPQTEFVSEPTAVNEMNVLAPDPAERVFVRQDLLDANPGRPGAPVSIPGYPIETASSGIKAPQYFAPGVAGDHGEPIAQFVAVGGYLVPNNLSANAHGNGYADPNIFVPLALESVQVDGGAFNVREGNHALNLATTYALHSHLDPFFTLTGDQRDITATGGFSPSAHSWIAAEASYGNGFLDRLEHRKQIKLNSGQVFHKGNHT